MICRNDISKLKYRKITNMPPHARWQSSLNGEKTVSSGWYFHTVKLNWKIRVINSYLRIWKRKFHIDISLYLKFHLSKLILNRFRPCNSNTYSIYSIEDFIMVTTFILLGTSFLVTTLILIYFLIQMLQCYLVKIWFGL